MLIFYFCWVVPPHCIAVILLIPPLTIVPIMWGFGLAAINPLYGLIYTSCYLLALFGGYWLMVLAEYLGSDFYF